MNYNISANIKVAADGTQTVVHQTQKIADNLDAAQKSASKLNQASKGRTGVQSLASPGGSGGRGGSGGGGSGGGGGDDPRSYRGNRGAAGLRGAAGRDFAGLAVAGGNTTGLVAAYATLAANIFALTAAFKALSDAAKAVQLEKGLEQIGAMSGRTLKPIAKDVRELSGFALSTVESMKTVASATAAGFSGDEISRLTKVAKGASTALGRDLSDSMDRLTRGTIKLEPELLDELGIMTRLNDATKRYALENNKTVSSLTQVERRQAFLNAVLAEGEQKFGGIADSVPVSQFDKLAATIKDFGTAGLKIINDVLDPLLSLLISFPVLALLPLATMFKLTFSKLLPDMDSFVDRANQKVADFDRTISKARNKQEQIAAKDVGILDRYYGKDSSVFDTAAALEPNYNLEGGNDQLTLTKLQTAAQKDLFDLEKQYYIAARDGQTGLAQQIGEQIQNRRKVIQLAKDDLAILQATKRFEKTNIVSEGKSAAAVNQATRAEQFDIELASSSGLDQLGVVAKSVGGSLKQSFIDWGDTAKKQLDATGNKSIGLTRKLALIGPLMRTASVGFVGFGAAASMALKGIEASLGIIFLIITAVTLAFQAFVAVADFITGNTEERKAAREDLKASYDTSVQLVKEAQKFRENNDLASAIDAAVNSMTTLLDTYQKYKKTTLSGEQLKEIQNPNERLSVAGEGIINRVYNEEERNFVKGISNSMQALDPTAFKDFFNTFLIKSNESKQAGLDFAEKTAKSVSKLSGVFASVKESAKTMNDTISKIRSPDIFNVPYKPFADGLVEINKSLDVINSTYSELGLDSAGAKAGVADALLGSPDALDELGRVTGKTKLISKTRSEILKTETAISALEKVRSDKNLTGEQVIQLDTLNKQLITQKGTIADVADGSAVLKVQTAAYSEILGQANLKLAQMKQTYQDLVVNAQRQANSIAKMNRDIKNLDRYNTTDFGKINSDAEGVRNARETYDIAVRTAEIKKDVIRQEAALLKAQTDLQLVLQKQKFAEMFPTLNFESLEAGLGTIFYGQVAKLPLADQALPKIMADVLLRMSQLNTITDQVTGKRVQAVNLEIESLHTAYDLSIAQLGATIRDTTSLEYKVGVQKTLNDLKDKELQLTRSAAEAKIDRDEATALREARAKGRSGLTAQQEVTFARQRNLVQQDSARDLIAAIKKAMFQNMLDAFSTNRRALTNYKVQRASIVKERSESKDFGNKIALSLQLKDLDKNFNTQSLDRLKNYNSLLANSNMELDGAESALQGLIDALSGLVDAVDDMDAKFSNRLKETKRTGELGSDPVGSLLSGMGFSFGSNLVSAREQIVGEFGTGMFEGPEGEQKLQRMALALAEQTTQANLLNDAMQQVGASAAQAFSIMISSPKDAQQAFRDFIISTLSMIAQLLIQMAIMAALKAIIDPAGTAIAAAAAPAAVATAFEAGASVSQMLSKGVNIMPIGLAAGGVMGRSKGVQGVVSSPTYLVGEGKYNEAVVPLPNGRDIPVQLHGTNSGTNNVSVNVNMANGSSNTQMSGNDGANLGAAIARAVQKELLAQKAPGGILNKYGVA